jgi:hypothetical protein
MAYGCCKQNILSVCIYIYIYINVCDFICRFLFDDSGGDLHRPMDFLLDILDKMGDGAAPQSWIQMLVISPMHPKYNPTV